MPVSVARQIAFDILLRVETKDAYASDLLYSELNPKIKPQDAALATELTMGALRNARLLDFLIETYSRKKIASLDTEVVVALRLGIYQLRFLERVPARAAIHESVELVKRARKRSAAAFVNAVLHRASKDGAKPAAEVVPRELPRPERLGILYSHPAWLVARWIERYGEERAVALLEADSRAPKTSGVFRHPETRKEDARELERENVHIEPGHWLRDAFRVQSGNVAGSEAFRLGRVTIEDEASQMIPLLLGVEAGDSVLDVCAAPGGKTATLARRAGEDAFGLASDIHPHRLRAMKAQLKKLKLNGVRLVALDATGELPFTRKFRRILVDAPCSGTGTLARNPEIRARLRAEDLREFHARQVAMLRSALARLEDGGRLVYSTCSLESEENEDVVAEVLRENAAYRRVNRDEMISTLQASLAEGADAGPLFDDEGNFRTFSPQHQTDGFFAAAIEKIR